MPGKVSFSTGDIDLTFVCELFAVALGHLLWQGCVIAAAAMVVTHFSRSSLTKYWTNLLALVGLFLCLPLTLQYCATRDSSFAKQTSVDNRRTPLLMAPDDSEAPINLAVDNSNSKANLGSAENRQDKRQADGPSPAAISFPTSPTPRIYFPAVVVCVYCVGVAVMLLRLFLGILASRTIRLRAADIENPSVRQVFEAKAHRIGLKRIPALKSCSQISTPLVVGLVKPAILLPTSLVTGLPTEHLGNIIAHELVHLRRHDLLINLIQRVIECILFYHPAAWWISREVSRYREHACDDQVIERACTKMEYVDSLLQLAEQGLADSCARQRLILAANGVSPSEFRRRILRILGEKEMNQGFQLIPMATSSLIFVGTIVVSVYSATLAQDTPSIPPVTAHVNPGEWPQWGGNSLRNNVIDGETPIEWSVQSGKNIKWVASLEDSSFFAPVIAEGKVYASTNSAADEPKAAKMVCFDQESGKLLWSYSSPRLASGRLNDWHGLGMGSSPAVAGDFLYFLSNRCEVVCLRTGSGKVVWKTDLIEKRGVLPCKMQTSSPTIVDGILLVGTSHGVSTPPGNFNPDAPSFVALDCQSGTVVWADASPGDKVLHGQWSSPAYGVFNGVPQAIFAGGDGWVYSFDFRDIRRGKSNLLWKFDCNPKRSQWIVGAAGTRNNLLATPVIYEGLIYIGVGQNPEHGEGPGHLWCIDPNRRGDVSSEISVLSPDPVYRIQTGDQLAVYFNDQKPLPRKVSALRSVIEHGALVQPDGTIHPPQIGKLSVRGLTVDEAQQRLRGKYAAAGKAKDQEIYLTIKEHHWDPRIARDKFQAAGDQDLVFANPNSAAVWHYTGEDLNRDGKVTAAESFHRTCCSVAIKDGLLFATDFTGFVHCLDARTGKAHWTHDLYSQCYSTPLIVNDRVYIGDEDGDVAIFKHSKNKTLLSEPLLTSSISGPLVSDGQSIYIPSRTALTVIQEGHHYDDATNANKHEEDTAQSSVSLWQRMPVDEDIVKQQIADLQKSLAGTEKPSPTILQALKSLRKRLQTLQEE